MPGIGGVIRSSSKEELGDAIRSHKEAISQAITTGDMDQVRKANEKWFKEEMKEVDDYSRMING